MSLNSNFPKLFPLFVGYFNAYSHENMSSQQIMNMFAADSKRNMNNEAYISMLLTEIEKLIKDIDIYWKEVSSESNVYFKTVSEAIVWLENVKRFLLNEFNSTN